MLDLVALIESGAHRVGDGRSRRCDPERRSRPWRGHQRTHRRSDPLTPALPKTAPRQIAGRHTVSIAWCDRRAYVMLAEIETFLFAAETVGGDVSADAVDGGGNPGLEIGRQRDVAKQGEALLSGGDGQLHDCLHRRTHLSVRVFRSRRVRSWPAGSGRRPA